MSVLSVLVDEVDLNPPLRALCAGYEAGTWRADGLARAMSEALPNSHCPTPRGSASPPYTGVRLLRRAAETIYASDKYAKRGEFGELLLHVVLTEFFGTEPAISKLFFKDTPNDTVKGFDSVHVARVDEALELWLGEVKYYEDLDDAIRDVLREPVGCRPELANRPGLHSRSAGARLFRPTSSCRPCASSSGSSRDRRRGHRCARLGGSRTSCSSFLRLTEMFPPSSGDSAIWARNRTKPLKSVLEFVRSWPGHHFPNLALALQRLEEDVLPRFGRRPGDYRAYVGRVEHQFLPPFAAALEEYGLPVQVSIRIPRLLDGATDLDDVLGRLRGLDASRLPLSSFERSLVVDVQSTL